MTLVSDGFGVASFLVLIVPGLIFASTRASLRGHRAGDQTASMRLLQGAVASVVFSAAYAAVFAWWLGDIVLDPLASLRESPGWWSVTFLGLGIVLPATLAWILYGRAPFMARPNAWLAAVRDKFIGTGHIDVPTAWDWAPTITGAGWVRIRIAPGDWVGGKFTRQSLMSTYPEPRDIFIEEPWKLDQDGAFERKITGGRGLWIAVKDEYFVEWVNDDSEGET